MSDLTTPVEYNQFKKILDWLKGYNFTYNWIDFNVTPVEAGNVSVNTVSTVREIQSYIDGSRVVDLTFAITLVCDYDTEQSEVNLDAMQDYLNMSGWIEEQNADENFPDIEGEVYHIVALQTVPTVVPDNDMKVAKYQGQFTIRYKEEQ